MKTSISLVKQVSSPKARILFLGYSQKQTSLINKLVNKKCEVWHTEEIIQSLVGYDLVVSYGYRYMLKKHIIDSSSVPIINLHISYLPWNRGAHPNFWSFYDCTPSGVTIHLLDEGVDTGPIIFQRYVNFGPKENTFLKTYKRLLFEIEVLFEENIDKIISRNFSTIPQRRTGSYHSATELPKEFLGWDSVIQEEVVRLDSILNKNK